MEYVNIALIKDKSILLQFRDDKPDLPFPAMWAIPGGKVEEGESLEAAIKRELYEETGYELQNPQYYLTDTYKFFEGLPKVHFFWELFDGKQEIKCYEGQSMEFIPLEKLSAIPMFPGHDRYALRAFEAINAKEDI